MDPRLKENARKAAVRLGYTIHESPGTVGNTMLVAKPVQDIHPTLCVEFWAKDPMAQLSGWLRLLNSIVLEVSAEQE